jgi:hypothetical protein
VVCAFLHDSLDLDSREDETIGAEMHAKLFYLHDPRAFGEMHISL